MNLLRLLEKSRTFWFLFATSLVFFFLRLPSFFEPYWYGDEGIYQVIGLAMRQGRLLYRDIWDNKPPLLYVLYSVFNSDQFIIRIVSFVFGLLAILTFFFLLKRLLTTTDGTKNVWPSTYIATAFFTLLFGLPLLEGNIANAENFMLFPTLLAALFLTGKKAQSASSQIIAGILLSLAFLFKVVALFDFTAFVVFLLITGYTRKEDVIKQLQRLIPISASFLVPIFLVALYFLTQNALTDFITAVFKQNVGYVGYGNTFIIPQGLLILKLFFLFSTCLVLFTLRKKLPQILLFTYIWLAFSLFDAFFSQRPYTHYLLVLLPSLMLLAGYIIFSLDRTRIEKTKRLQGISIGIFIIIVIVLNNNFTLYRKNILYYKNFIDFVTNKKDVVSYQSFFDTNTPKEYALGAFLASHARKEDGVFLWGDSAETYQLANKLPLGRFTVAYHMTTNAATIQETKALLVKTKPRYIVIFPKEKIPFSLVGYRERYDIYGRIIYERIY